MSRRTPRLAITALALGAALVVSQLFAAWPWQAGVAVGVVLLVVGAVSLSDARAGREFRRYGEGFFDGRHQALREVTTHLDPHNRHHVAVLDFINSEAPPDAVLADGVASAASNHNGSPSERRAPWSSTDRATS